jgi:di/tricarboxylate transporter
MLIDLGIDAWITIVTLVAVMAALLFTRLRSDVVFLGAIGILFVTGVLDTTEAFSGLVSSTVIIVGVMFVVVTGLSFTGVLQWISKHVLGQPKGEVHALLRLMVPVALLSSFVNNTSVVALFVGVVKLWSRKLGIQPSKLLIPLSYAAGMGGPMAAIATPTALLLSDMYEYKSGQPLSIFTSTLPALVCLAVAMSVIIIFRRLLPDTNNPESAFENTGEYTLEMLVPSNNRHIGQTVGELGLNHVPAGSLMELIHFDNDRLVLPVREEEPLLGSDRLIFSGQIDQLLELAKTFQLVIPDHTVFSVKEPGGKQRLKTAYICFGSNLIDTRMGDTTFERDHEITLVAVSRRGERIKVPPRDVVLHAGDSLLFVHQPHQKINTEAMKLQLEFFDSPEIPVTGLKPLVSTVIMISMVLLATTGIMSLLQSAFLAAGAMLVFGCCTPTQAMNAIKWNILISLGGGIALGTALLKTGLANQMATGVLHLCGGQPLLVMIALCLLAAIVTEFISNSATIALMFPIIYEAAVNMGCDPLPFSLALLLAVNAAFLTPISTPLNLLVYGPGGYSATDYLRIGLPVKLAYLAISIIVICLIYGI